MEARPGPREGSRGGASTSAEARDVGGGRSGLPLRRRVRRSGQGRGGGRGEDHRRVQSATGGREGCGTPWCAWRRLQARALISGARSAELRRPRRASEMPRRRSGVRRSGLSPQTGPGRRMGRGVVRQGRWPLVTQAGAQDGGQLQQRRACSHRAATGRAAGRVGGWERPPGGGEQAAPAPQAPAPSGPSLEQRRRPGGHAKRSWREAARGARRRVAAARGRGACGPSGAIRRGRAWRAAGGAARSHGGGWAEGLPPAAAPPKSLLVESGESSVGRPEAGCGAHATLSKAARAVLWGA